jgi:ADP-sugar diphosphatase
MISRTNQLARHLNKAKVSAAYRGSSAMSTFQLPNWTPAVPVSLPDELTQEQLLSFPAFKNWISTLQHSLSLQKSQKDHTFHPEPYTLRKIDVQSVDFFGGLRVGFVKLKTEVTNDKGEKFPGSVFLRGGSVAMMVILQDETFASDSEEGKFVLLTVQPRIPAGTLGMVELPAGMIDDSGTFGGAAAKEIKEELDMDIKEDELQDMTRLALNPTEETSGEKLQRAVYTSPGGSDE